MKFGKFKLFKSKEESLYEGEEHEIVINLDHLVSVRPINIATSSGLVKAYWLRLTNGKKYRAIEIPATLKNFFEKKENIAPVVEEETSSLSSALH